MTEYVHAKTEQRITKNRYCDVCGKQVIKNDEHIDKDWITINVHDTNISIFLACNKCYQKRVSVLFNTIDDNRGYYDSN